MKRHIHPFSRFAMALGKAYGSAHAACPDISHQQLSQVLNDSGAAPGGPNGFEPHLCSGTEDTINDLLTGWK